MSEIERLNMIAEWQEQHKQLIEDLDNSKKRIEELEEKISVLLSCKNCPENKGGLICQKEYENKCLTQKIQFIKELQKKNAELKEINTYTLSQLNLDNGELIIENEKLKKENAELKDYRLTTVAKQQTDLSKYALNLEHKLSWYDDQLTKAKEIIKKFSEFVNNEVEYDPEHPQEHTDLWNKLCEEAGQFLSEEK